MGCQESKDSLQMDSAPPVSDSTVMMNQAKNSFDLDSNDFTITEFIQEGGMGKVYCAKNKGMQNSLVALKFFGYTQKPPDVESIQEEIEILVALKGIPGIVEIHGTFIDTPTGCIPGKRFPSVHPVIVMDYLTGGDMFDRIQYQETVSERDLSRIFRQIIVALDSVHQRGYIHRDLKLENVMLADKSPDPVVKLIDFGMMVSLPHDSDTLTSTTVLGTAGYVAPESLLLKQYSSKSDMWQAGCCLYSLLSGYFPFHPDHPKRIVRAQYFAMAGVGWDIISDDVKDLIRQILVANPRERLSAKQILSHRWLAGNAATTDLGTEYFDRIKQLALRQKLKRFFAENDINAKNSERRERLQRVLPFLKGSSGNKEEQEMIMEKINTFREVMIDSLHSSSFDGTDGHPVQQRQQSKSDAPPSRVINFDTFVKVLNEAGLPELALESVFNIFDIGNTGDIDLKDFLITMLAFRPMDDLGAGDQSATTTDTQTIRLYFDIFDINGTGYIDLEELKTAVGCLLLDESNLIFSMPGELAAEEDRQDDENAEQHANMSHVMDLFSAMDVSKDGKVDYHEFESFYTAVMMNSASRTLVH